MSNIMLIDACNLACPYCFANEFVNKNRNEITEEAFALATDFIVGDGTHQTIGLIGGEPTLHSKFDLFMRKLIRDTRVKGILVYTNGLLLDNYWDVITHPKTHLLINCNSPTDIGKKNYHRLLTNLEVLLKRKEFKENVTLGINLYKPDFEDEYLLELLTMYGFNHVRVSITVPNIECNRNTDAHKYFIAMKPKLLQFFLNLLEKNIVPNFDCNKIPSCLISDNEIKLFQKYLKNPELEGLITNSNISTRIVKCAPVIDIRQDLTAVRCFGLSEVTKQNILDFKGIRDLENYYLRSIDAYAYNTVYSDKCKDCYDRKTLKCSGGCYAFKIKAILEAQKFSESEHVEIYGRN